MACENSCIFTNQEEINHHAHQKNKSDIYEVEGVMNSVINVFRFMLFCSRKQFPQTRVLHVKLKFADALLWFLN